MGGLGGYKPEMAMSALQFSYATVALVSRAALVQGMSPRVFVVYRQAVATLVIAPIAYFTRRKSGGSPMGLKNFSLIFLATLIGVTINQNIYFEGLLFASSSIATATGNLIPGITFLIASALGLEKIDIRSSRTIAKIVGTVVCVIGAVSMALLKGPRLLNESILGTGDNWLMGCLLLFGSACAWSLWLILQVPVTASYRDHLSLSAWMCFLATIQSGIVTLFLEPDPDAWKLHSNLELFITVFAGVIGSGLSFFVQAWCIAQRGPLFSAMFNPLNTVIVTILAAIFLHEQVYTGSLVGAAGVIIGLYIVLWGKAKDIVKVDEKKDRKPAIDDVKILTDDSSNLERNKVDLEEPFLSDKDKSNDRDDREIKSQIQS